MEVQDGRPCRRGPPDEHIGGFSIVVEPGANRECGRDDTDDCERSHKDNCVTEKAAEVLGAHRQGPRGQQLLIKASGAAAGTLHVRQHRLDLLVTRLRWAPDDHGAYSDDK